MKTAPERVANEGLPSADLAAATEEDAYRQKRAARSREIRIRFYVDRTIAIVVPLVGWQMLSDHWVGGKWISSPLSVLDRLISMARDGSLQMHTWQTLEEALVGLLCGLVLGIVIGVLL